MVNTNVCVEEEASSVSVCWSACSQYARVAAPRDSVNRSYS
jgi:hypothetical protein